VGIYLGNGMQIDAPRPGKSVQIRGIWQSNPTFVRF
jgi:cell wall-associated NlpC family hydrolase